MAHLVLLGDSIFDNRSYVEGGPAVVDQVQEYAPTGWRASLLAVDGDTTLEVLYQLARLPGDATHLVLSVGGNDALGCLDQMGAEVRSVMEGLQHLHRIQGLFQKNYRAVLGGITALNLPLTVCTVYDGVPGLSEPLKTALSLFNDSIIRSAISLKLPVLDLRMICDEPSDYSSVSPIEPSSAGGSKIARALLAAVTRHSFDRPHCQVYS